jgi:anti-anti-sigma regulatory factor
MDVGSRLDLQAAVDHALARLGQRRLTLDLTRVGMTDSTGLGELIGCLAQCDRETARWELRPSLAVERLLMSVRPAARRPVRQLVSSGGYGAE